VDDIVRVEVVRSSRNIQHDLDPPQPRERFVVVLKKVIQGAVFHQSSINSITMWNFGSTTAPQHRRAGRVKDAEASTLFQSYLSSPALALSIHHKERYIIPFPLPLVIATSGSIRETKCA
jgi:hypothetical protein